MVGHEISGSDPRVARIQVNCRGVGCVAAGGALREINGGEITNHNETGIL